ncbi:uncharacterized protein TNCV_1231941 [Trichonephila clavipes]|nr:uncharacterized protein TNCV_1231941 [Trichonephila clavipes]
MSRTPTRFKQHGVTTTRPMNCYAVSTRLGRSRHRFFSLPSGRGQPFVNQESGLKRNVGASKFNEPDGRQGCVPARAVVSNQGGRFDSNESVADSFPCGAVSFKSSYTTILGASFPLTSARKKPPVGKRTRCPSLGYSYRPIGARVQRNSSTVIRVWKQWTDEHRTAHKTGSGQKVTLARDDRHLLRIVVNDRIASSRQ